MEYDWYDEQHVSQALINRYNVNYIYPFIELAKFYYLLEEFESAEYWKNKAVYLAKKADNETLMKEIEEEIW